MADDALAVRAAELYYEGDKTQDEIGRMLGITRWKVGRLLGYARERGIVRIEIVHPLARRVGLEQALRDRFGLRAAIVVPAEGDRQAHERVVHATAELLSRLRPAPRLLGVSWGRTLGDVADRLPTEWARGVEVVQVNGGVTPNRRAGTASTTAITIAQKAGGRATLLPSPEILERIETKHAIESDRTVRGVIELAQRATAVLFSAGPADAGSALVESGYLTVDEVDALARRGAVGDVLGRFIDADGCIVDRALDDRTVGLDLERLRATDTAVLAIAGTAKHPVARAVVANGLCTAIVTDEATAESLLEE